MVSIPPNCPVCKNKGMLHVLRPENQNHKLTGWSPFDMSDHAILTPTRHLVYPPMPSWFLNYLFARSQCVHFASFFSFLLPIKSHHRVPYYNHCCFPFLYSSVIRQMLLSISCRQVVQCSSPSVVQTIHLLQSASSVVQFHLTQDELVLNVDKSNLISKSYHQSFLQYSSS